MAEPVVTPDYETLCKEAAVRELTVLLFLEYRTLEMEVVLLDKKGKLVDCYEITSTAPEQLREASEDLLRTVRSRRIKQ